MPDPTTDPTLRLVADIAFAIVGVGLAAWLIPRQLRRLAQYGGRPAARWVVVAATIALAVGLQPELLDPQSSLALVIIGVLLALRVESVVRYTGGPRPEWVALAEGTALERLVARYADRSAAARAPLVREHLATLAAAEFPATARYAELLRATLFADPEGPGMSERLAALAVEEAALRRVVGPRPAFEGGLVSVDEAPIPDAGAEGDDADAVAEHADAGAGAERDDAEQDSERDDAGPGAEGDDAEQDSERPGAG